MKKAFIGTLLFAVLLAAAGNVSAVTFSCPSNPDFFSNRCTVHPNAVTRVTDGVVEKGHLVGCQSKSWTCIRSDGRFQCKDNYGSTVVPFSFPMTDLKAFCTLLCTKPECKPADGWRQY